VDPAWVVELYSPAAGAAAGGQVGSGYRVGPETVLTAGHVVAGLPVHGPDAPVPVGGDEVGVCLARPLGEPGWVPAVVIWRDEGADVAVLRLARTVPPLPAGSPGPRWGRVDGTEPVAVSAVGFPWAQERPDRVRDTEQLFGFVAPATTAKEAVLAVTVLTAPPTARAGGSAWAGMSGAALFAGPFLVGVLVVDPDRFGPDRLVAAAVAPLLTDPALAGLLDADEVVGVGPRLRLAVSAEVSVAVAPPYRAATPRLGREQARLLLPEYGIVPFTGRDGDLDGLRSWCVTGAGPGLRVILGSGGSGKTRLAAEVCARLTGKGWQAGFADPQAPGGRPELAFDRPTLLVVDDADLQVPLLEALVRTLGYWPTGASPVRLLLLARHTVGWWDTLNQRTDQLAGELTEPPLLLRDGELPPADRGDHHARALAAFAPHLPDAVTPVEQEPRALTDPAFANPLLVHMHALLTACGAHLPTTGAGVRERILDAVLDRERKRWAATFPAGVPTGGARTHQQAVSTMTLLAPPTETTTGHALTVIGEFAPEAAAGARAAATTWLRELYPGADPPWVAPLRPDLLAEQLLATTPELPDLTLAAYPHAAAIGQIVQLLSELTRAATRPAARAALDQLLAAHLPDLLAAAVADPAGPMPTALDLAVTACPQPAAASHLLDRLPAASVGLAPLAATLSGQTVEHHRELAEANRDAYLPDLAASVHNLAIDLAEAGRRAEGLTAAQQAVDLYRDLAAANRDAHLPDLAASVHNLATHLRDAGRREEALALASEASTHYHDLARTDPDVFGPTADRVDGLVAALGENEL
jgi:Trypsin-like peptidase domain